MLISDIIRLSTRMFRTNRSRTILTILGISVGIGTILFLVSLGYGLQRMILNQITSSETLLTLEVGTGGLENIKLSSESIEEIKAIRGVERISPLISSQAIMNLEGVSSELPVNFADYDYFRLSGISLSKGEYYRDEEANNKAIISSAVLDLYGLDKDGIIGRKADFTIFIPSDDRESGLGDYIELTNEFEITGLIEEESAGYAYLPFSVSQEIHMDNYSLLKVKVQNEGQLAGVREAIEQKGFLVSALSDIIEQTNQIFGIFQIILALFGIVALIVSAIGMFNTMTIALLERTREIGIMKALGATKFDIWNLFLGESIIIGFLGGLGGIILGFLGGKTFNFAINILAEFFGGEKINIFYTPVWFILLIAVFSTFVGILTGFYPARRAAKINCLEALRYK